MHGNRHTKICSPSQFRDEDKIYDHDFEASTQLQTFKFMDHKSSVEVIALKRSVRIKEAAPSP